MKERVTPGKEVVARVSERWRSERELFGHGSGHNRSTQRSKKQQNTTTWGMENASYLLLDGGKLLKGDRVELDGKESDIHQTLRSIYAAVDATRGEGAGSGYTILKREGTRVLLEEKDQTIEHN